MTELVRPLRADRIVAGEAVEIIADAAECQALTARMMIESVDSFLCRFRLTPSPGGVVLAEGDLVARVTQICVVGLEPFGATVREAFRIRFVPAGTEGDDEDPESEDELPYDGGVIDLGEAAAEQLALALDPFPRAPDAKLPPEATEALDTPFAALARLRRPQ